MLATWIRKPSRNGLVLAAAALAVSAAAVAFVKPGVAYAQSRDPAYAAARAQGLVGEKMDGYLGIVGAASSEVRKLVEDINIKRRANYTERAKAQNVTVEEYALAQGCILIARTAPGEKYQAPDGSWRTRGSEPPARDARCP